MDHMDGHEVSSWTKVIGGKRYFGYLGRKKTSSWVNTLPTSARILGEHFKKGNELSDIAYFMHYASYRLGKGADLSQMEDLLWEQKVRENKMTLSTLLDQSSMSEDMQKILEGWKYFDEKDEKYCDFTNTNVSNAMYKDWCMDCFKSEEIDCLDMNLSYDLIRHLGTIYIIHYSSCLFQESNHRLCLGRLGVNELLAINHQTSIGQNTSALELWLQLNSPIVNFDDEFQESLFGKFENEKIQGIDKKWLDLLRAPTIHGNYITDYVLVPFCSFGSTNLSNCTMFQRSLASFDHKVCYTFNRDKKDAQYKEMTGLEKKNGLNFAINYRMPRLLEKEPVEIILHGSGTIPDLKNSKKIFPGQEVVIGIQGSFTQITDGFMDLTEEQKECRSEPDYDQVACKLKKKIEIGKMSCGCVPWYMNDTSKVCGYNESFCFDQWMKQHMINNCPDACEKSKFYLQVEIKDTEIEEESEETSLGSEWEAFISDGNPMMFPVGDRWGSNKVSEYISIVHVNYVDPEVEVITKDAKVTFSDQLGTIGGTLGVFIGLSLLKIIDFLLEMKTQILSIIRNKKV